MTISMAVGLMSGTSCDGVDAAAVATDGRAEISVAGGLTLPYPDDLRARLSSASAGDAALVELLRVEKDVSEHHVRAVRVLLDRHPKVAARVQLVGFHGHTVRHVAREGLTMQIGNPWQLAHALQLPIVSDFRRCDIAAGGQGAPLVAMFHQALFADEPRPVVILNLGGVANLTWLGEGDQIVAGDTGPGCGLLDAWVQTKRGKSCDEDGRLAAAGTVDEAAVAAALTAPFFAQPLPKSADRYEFDHVDVSHLSAEDGAATLCRVTVEAIRRTVQTLPAMPARVWVCGGGVHHPVLMRMLGEHFDVRSIVSRGLDPDTLEAQCFAWLAVRHRARLPLTLPATTGCPAPLCGGVIAEID